MMKTVPKTKAMADRHEREYAALVPNTTQTPASGAVYERHDARSNFTDENEYWRFRSEMKCTQKKSYSFKVQEWLDLVEYAALQGGERPVWAVRFYDEGEEALDLPVKADLVVVGINDWAELLDELDDLRAKVGKE